MGAWQESFRYATQQSCPTFDHSEISLAVHIKPLAYADSEKKLSERLQEFVHYHLQGLPLREIMPVYHMSQGIFDDEWIFVAVDEHNRRWWLHDGERELLDADGNGYYAVSLLAPSSLTLSEEIVRACDRHISVEDAGAIASKLTLLRLQAGERQAITTGELFAMLPEVIRRAATYADKGWAVRPLDEFSEGRVYAGFSLTYTK